MGMAVHLRVALFALHQEMDVAGTKSARGAHTKAEEIDRQLGE